MMTKAPMLLLLLLLLVMCPRHHQAILIIVNIVYGDAAVSIHRHPAAIVRKTKIIVV